MRRKTRHLKIFTKNTKFIDSFYRQSLKIMKFLNNHNIYHYDCHSNIFLVDDNENVYITDLGLSLGKEFMLDKYKINFIEKNKKFDQILILFNILVNYYQKYIK